MAFFYGQNISDAAIISAELLKNIPYEPGEFRQAKYEFFQANVLFKQEDYKAALQILSQRHEISKDKIGWDIAIRVLTTMALIELQRLDEASLQIEGLRKHIDRHSKLSEIKERDKLILKVLLTIDQQGFVFDKKNKQNIKRLELLKSKSKKYCWEPLIPELIPFNEWLEKKYS